MRNIQSITILEKFSNGGSVNFIYFFYQIHLKYAAFLIFSYFLQEINEKLQ